MTLSTTINRVSYDGDDSTTEFPFVFKFLNKSAIKVVLRDALGVETLLTITTHYTLTDPGDSGTVTMLTAPAIGETLVIYREVALTQTYDPVEGGSFPVDAAEDAWDKNMMAIQQLEEAVGRAIQLPISSEYSDLEIPDPSALKLMRWNAAADALENVNVESLGALSVSDYIKTLLDDADQRSARVTLGNVEYLADATETDQGAIGNGRSIKDLVDLIGTSKFAVINLKHSGAGNQTTYTLTTSITIPSNILLIIEPGAIIDGAGTLTLKSFISGHYQIFGSSITVSFVAGSVEFALAEWWLTNTTPGTTDMLAALNKAIAAYSDVKLSGVNYAISDAVTANTSTNIFGTGDSSIITQLTSNKGGFNITASGVTLRNFKLVGPQYATSQTNERAIKAYGADSGHYINGLVAKGLTISNWGQDAINLQYVEDFCLELNQIDNCYYSGIMALSAQDGNISKNLINNITGTSFAYGITLTRTEHDSLATEPRSARINVGENIIKNVINWEGIDTHGGDSINIIGNQVYGCEKGIVAGPADNSSQQATFAPQNCHIIGNTINSGVTDGTKQHGIALVGASISATPQEYAKGCIILGNTLVFCGDKTNANDGAIYFHTTKGLIIKSNQLLDASPIGISIFYDNEHFSVSENVIIDAWADSGNAMGIRVQGDQNTGYIGENTFIVDDSAKGTVLNQGIRVEDLTGVHVRLGVNYFHGVSSNIVDGGNRTFRGSMGDTVTSGTGEDDLKSIVLDEDLFGAGQTIHIRAHFKNTGTDGNKTGKFYFGTSVFTIFPASNDQNEWFADILIIMTGYNSQKLSMITYSGTLIVFQDYATAAISLIAADVTVKFTGECANAADTITQYTMDVEVK